MEIRYVSEYIQTLILGQFGVFSMLFFVCLGNDEYFYLRQSNDLQAVAPHRFLENVSQSPKKTLNLFSVKLEVKKDTKAYA